MFAIVISEKGGAERREAFEQPEISIGRVQGNDLMLPKGNVSKRHARLVYRDARFIVTDLNSTNGTYVNRRRISQATIVRQGDRIYIGDFVIRIETTDDSSGLSTSRASVAPAIPLREPMGSEAQPRSKPPAPPPPAYPPVPPAPRLPVAQPDSSAVASSPAPSSSSSPSGHSRAEASVVERLPSPREDSIDTEATAYRSAVAALVERVVSHIDSDALEREVSEAVAARVDQVLEEQLAELRRDDTIGASITDERLKRDARAELLELGALGPLLEDESVSEIAVAGPSAIFATRGTRRSQVEPPFSSEKSVRRILARLVRQSGAGSQGDESLVSRKLPSGVQLVAITGARAPSGTIIRLERSQRVDSTLDDLVRAGAISRAMATFMRHCMVVRANILIVGPREARPQAIAGALVSASPDGHVVALQCSDLIVSSAVSVSHIALSGADAELAALIEFAGTLPDARLVVDHFSGAAAAAVLAVVTGGADGLVAVGNAASLRRGLARLPADISGARPGLAVDTAREWISGTFDILIDVARLRDGRQRVVRIAEPAGVEGGEIVTRDIFTFSVERLATGGSVEGTFQATGVAPRVVNDMAARGIRIDSGVFSRPPSR